MSTARSHDQETGRGIRTLRSDTFLRCHSDSIGMTSRCPPLSTSQASESDLTVRRTSFDWPTGSLCCVKQKYT